MIQENNPGALFDTTFIPTAVQAIIAAVKRAYSTACEHYDPGRGSNENTFGYSLYEFGVYEFRQEAKLKDNPLRIISVRPTFRLAIGEFKLACHRVGRSASQDICSSLPSNDGAACKMVEEQLRLPGMEDIYDLPKARKVVIAHLGNPDDGLGAIYLCIPGRTDGERITSWAYTRGIWHVDNESRHEAPVALLTPGRPDDEIIATPAVRKKPKKDRKNPPREDSEKET